MKSAATWIFWIFVAVAAWRWLGTSIRDFEDKTLCTYQNRHGDCMTQADYIKLVAHDAATDAITDFIAECNGPFSSSDAHCALLRRN